MGNVKPQPENTPLPESSLADFEGERAYLGTAFHFGPHPEATDDLFFSGEHRAIHQELNALAATGKLPIDLLELREGVQRRGYNCSAEYLVEFSNCLILRVPLERRIARLRKFAARRELARIATQIFREASDPTADIGQIRDSAISRLMGAGQ